MRNALARAGRLLRWGCTAGRATPAIPRAPRARVADMQMRGALVAWWWPSMAAARVCV
ncbi:hypothetical protein [Saccharopolyspora rosea]|uniref:Uncharacterized protein n=1 Tax=Saccharopolyspora rosea TaxID=524884 RepID=A0ABW3FSG1_9PSEU|nr:hypothetical protein [Saccharopolyspora rosea]